MLNQNVSGRPRVSHLMVMFGLFLSLLAIAFNGLAAPHTIAFGTSEVADLSNQYRTNAGLSALTTNQKLTNSAQAKADDMATKGYFAHDSPDGSTPWDFFANAGYNYVSAGENLALSNQSAASVSDGWYNSPGHRANMLSDTFMEVGYGIAFVENFNYNGTNYQNVYLVAAHYALPPTSNPIPVSSTPSAPAPVKTEVAGESLQPSAQSQTASSEAATPQQGASASSTPTSNNDIASSAAEDNLPKPLDDTVERNFSIGSKALIVGLTAGATLVFVGILIEIRRLVKHQPLFPRVHHQ